MKSLLFAGLCAILFAPFAKAANPRDELVKLAAEGNGIIKLNPQTYELLTSAKRTWSASVQFTAMDPRRRCAPCQSFDPEWKLVANAWNKVSPKNKDEHFFATIDFDEASSIFQKMGLASAPVVFNYPPASGDRKPASGKTGPLKYDFSDGFDAGPLAEVISRFTPIPIPYTDPIDWNRVGVAGTGVIIFLVGLRFVAPIFQNRWTWAAGTVLMSLVMTSGFMFSRIRGVPWTGADGNWVAASPQNQFGQEVQVVAFVYGLLAFSFVMLTMVVPYQRSASKQRMQIYLWTGVIMIIYSVLVSLFRVKNRNYPFRLFL